MSRPLRIEFPGSLLHVTSRGNNKWDTFLTDKDRVLFLEYLAEAVERFCWILTAYVLMSNHFHLLIELTASTLSKGMQWLNSGYARAFNRRHGRVGHLFQARFHAALIEKETYFLEVARYVVLNPVRARMVVRPENYKWSSYRSTTGDAPVPDWLAADDLLLHFADGRERAQAYYRRFVDDPIARTKNPWADLIGDIYLGSDEWADRMRKKVEMKPRSDEHPRAQRMVTRPSMADIVSTVADLMGTDNDVVRHGHGGVPRMLAAWLGSHEALLTNREIAAGLRLRSAGHVSDLVGSCDRELTRNAMLREAADRCAATLGRKNRQPKL